MRNKIREFILINIGLFLVAIGIYYFLVPNNLAAGGVFGLAMVINSFLPQFSVGVLMLGMNVILFIIGFIFIGFDFGFRTIYSSFALSGMVWLLQKTNPINEPLVNDILIQLIFGILISAIGMAIVFNNNASTGGTDIIAKILNKYFHIELGKGVLIADFIITLSAGLVFGLEIGMYALLGVIMNGIAIDNIIEGFNLHKQVVVITNRSEQIKKFIVEELERGATIYCAKGAFTNEQKEVISTIVNRRQFIKLRNFIRHTDSRAFITVSSIHEIIGEGFRRLD